MSTCLGTPIPNTPHAASVSLPSIDDVIGYEEGDEETHAALKSGYPRFVFASAVKKLNHVLRTTLCKAGEVCLPLPNYSAAQRCISLTGSYQERCRIVKFKRGAHCIYVAVGPCEVEKTFKLFWQHTGFIVSSRLAETFLAEQTTESKGESLNSPAELKERIAEYAKCDSSDVFLFSSGMAAITSALLIAAALKPEKKSLQFGFPYLDSLKVQKLLGFNPAFFPKGSSGEIRDLKKELPAACAVFCEAPSNPLLVTPPIRELSRLARNARVPLIIDDTIGTWLNVDLAPHADITVTSLTKFFSGGGNAVGGALILRRSSPLYESLRDVAERIVEECLWHEDASTLLANSKDMPARVRSINHNALELAEFLKKHPCVAEVYYPGLGNTSHFDDIKCPDGGYGGVLSFVLKGGRENFQSFYDTLSLAKGPGLGTNFTLTCPYTLLAHYNELEWAASHGVSHNLLRVSVGTEQVEEILERFKFALTSLKIPSPSFFQSARENAIFKLPTDGLPAV